VGQVGPAFGIRLLRCPAFITTQQSAELFALDAATRLAVRLRWHHATIIGDNSGALYTLESLRPQLSNSVNSTTTRRIFNRLLQSGLFCHLLWAPTAFMPADAASRFQLLPGTSLPQLFQKTLATWKLLATNLHVTRLMVHIYV
jgi:hypothetical protein